MIPSGYKDQKVYSVKPLDGSGDLTFSRASSATRVASNGLIEKVRTNLLLQSNTFNTTWTLDDATLTSGQSGYDGTNNAWRLAKTAAGGRVQQTLSLSSNSHTFSVYVKAGTKNWVFLRADGTSNRTSYFDLQNGVVGTASGCTPSIVSAGNGWYRCSISYVDTTTSARIWVADADGDISGTSGNILIQSAQVETGDIATDYIATTTAAVSVGPVSGLPRLDYLNSTCPRLLLEPQRTNNLVYSEQFTNAAWATDGNGAGETKTANYAISPDGYQNADRIQLNRTGGSYSRIRQDYVAAGTHTGSVYLKSNTGSSQKVWMRVDGGTATKITITTSWQRFIVSGSTSAALELFIDNTDAEIATIADFSAWGCQLEAGAYATSYIPTLGTSVTRVWDDASKTGITSLIGQTAGTLFVELNADGRSNGTARVIAYLTANGSTDNRVAIQYNASGQIQAIASSGGSTQGSVAYTITGPCKAAFAYNSSGYELFVNGVSRGTFTGSLPTSLTRLDMNSLTGTFDELGGTINQVLIFKNRLSNSDLATLTTL